MPTVSGVRSVSIPGAPGVLHIDIQIAFSSFIGKDVSAFVATKHKRKLVLRRTYFNENPIKTFAGSSSNR